MAFDEFLDPLDRDAGFFQSPGGTRGGEKRKPIRCRRWARSTICSLCRSVTLMKIAPSVGRTTPAASWLLANAIENRSLIPITSPVLRISGPSTMSTPDEFAEGKYAFLDRNVWRDRFASDSQFGQCHARHHFGGDLGDGHPRRLGDKRHRAAGRGLTSST